MSAASLAAPRVPTSDDQVLERLPRGLVESRNEIERLQRQLAQRPGDPDLAAEVASRMIRLGKSTDDSRCFGYAQAAVARWWDQAEAPSSVALVRAKLKETDHQYAEALADLDRLLAREPGHVQAWVEVASVALVLGEYDRAAVAADRLEAVAGPVQALFARGPVLARTGKARVAYDEYSKWLPTIERELPGTVGWVATSQAEVAEALGLNAQADQHYRRALAADPNDRYLLRAYGDFLMDRGRAGEAVELLRAHTSDTGILLACAIAAKQSGQQQLSAELTEQLTARFDDLRLRQGTLHLRFEARYALQLQEDAKRALELSLACWSRQKEPRDMRTVLEGALAAGAPDAARPVLDFMKRHGIEDVRLQRVAEKLGAR